MLTPSIRLSFAVWRPRWFDREELEVRSLGFKLSIPGFLQLPASSGEFEIEKDRLIPHLLLESFP